MASEVGNDAMRRAEYYVVCIVDLLGQSDHMNGWAKLPQPNVDSRPFDVAVNKTVGVVEWFKKNFTQQLANFAANNLPSEQWSQLNEKQQRHFLRFKATEVKLQQFSDLFLFYAPLRNNHDDLTPTSIYRIIAACCIAMLSSLARKMPLRGAICFGTGLELEPNNFFGPALAQAHHIESKIAGYPRVVISREVVDFLRSNRGFSDDPVVDQCLAGLAKTTLGLCCKDTDGLMIANFLGKTIHEICDEQTTSVAAAVRLALEFVVSEQRRFARDNNSVLAERYSQLKRYMQAHQSIWGIE